MCDKLGAMLPATRWAEFAVLMALQLDGVLSKFFSLPGSISYAITTHAPGLLGYRLLSSISNSDGSEAIALSIRPAQFQVKLSSQPSAPDSSQQPPAFQYFARSKEVIISPSRTK